MASPATTLRTNQAPHGATTQQSTTATEVPLLVLFCSQRSGQCRRVEGFISHVLQRRHNHESFRYRVINIEDRPDLFERFRVDEVPTMMVIERKRVRTRLAGYVKPQQVEDALRPWLH